MADAGLVTTPTVQPHHNSNGAASQSIETLAPENQQPPPLPECLPLLACDASPLPALLDRVSPACRSGCHANGIVPAYEISCFAIRALTRVQAYLRSLMFSKSKERCWSASGRTMSWFLGAINGLICQGHNKEAYSQS